MSAKTELISRLKYLEGAVNLPELVDNGIVQSDHNGIANLLRKGLGIVAFNILEDFIKNRSQEALSALSSSLLTFNNLTDSLQESAIFGALNSLNWRYNNLKNDGSDWKLLIQDEALKIHSTKNHPYQLSQFSLVYSSSNVSSTEVSELIKAFGLNGGWNLMKSVSDSIGGGVLDLGQAYKQAGSRRNSSAHSANFQYTHALLSNLKSEILAIAASLDILLSARCRQVNLNPAIKLDAHNITTALNYRFLEVRGSIHRETTTIGGRSKKNWPSLESALLGLQPTLLSRNEFLVLLNSSGRIEDWYC